MTEIKPARMFAATHKNAPGRALVCVRWFAKEVRQEFGRMRNRDNWRAGWKRALKDGWRVIPVTITPEGEMKAEKLLAFRRGMVGAAVIANSHPGGQQAVEEILIQASIESVEDMLKVSDNELDLATARYVFGEGEAR